MKTFCCTLAAGLSLAGIAFAENDARPEWIWLDGEREGETPAKFLKEIGIDGEVSSARLKITADFAHLAIIVNGQPVAEIEAYDPPLDLNLRPHLESGKNLIEISALGVPGPSAVAAALTVTLRGGKSLEFLSDSGWLGEPGSQIASYGKIDPHRWAPNRLPEISPFAEYNQWKEATADAREQLSPLPPGFEIEKLYSAKPDEGSWISLAIDPKGRLIIAKEERGLLRLTLPAKAGGEIQGEAINDTLEECRGLVWNGSDLYANANRSLGLFRLRESTQQGLFDDLTLLRQTEGSTGHGRNDLALGPDQRIHAIHGDSVAVPENASLRTVPEIGAPSELGHWVSTAGDGSDWRIHARGLRNPYGIDFNPDGEAFTYDADNEGDVGLPFYRPTRINHLVSGANYGWHQDRGNTRNLTVYAPDSVPTTFDVGRGSPTAVKFGTRSNFPPPYRDALFALDWAYGRIIAVHLTPRGASYYGSGEIFLEGRPLNVTDLDFDADGAMYFVTGGRKTQSALYRVRYTGKPEPAPELAAQAKARDAFSEKARQFRKQLERYHGNPDPPDFEDAWDALGNPDPWIRNAARVAVETQDLQRWRLRALDATGDLHGLTALLALIRQGSDDDQLAVVERLAQLSPEGWNQTEKLTLLRIYEISEISGQYADKKLITNVDVQLHSLLNDLSDPVRRELVRILVAIGSPEAVPAGLRFLAASGDQFERLHYLEMLSEAQVGWTGEFRSAYFLALVHAKRFSFGDRLMEGFFQVLEKNALASIGDEKERARFATILKEEQSTIPDLGETPVRKEVKNWTLNDFSEVLEGSLGDRNLNRGKDMFDAALCSRCHVSGTHGRPVGPDLTTVASRFSRKDLLEAIIEPSKVVADVHRNVVITKNDGTLLQGRIIQNDFRKSLLYLSMNPFLPGDLTELPKGDIESFEESLISPMPPALLNTLTKEETLDLLAWLESGGSQ